MYVQFAPRRALAAARILASDPDDLPKVFTVIESLSVDTLERIARRLRASEAGRRLIETRPDITLRLADREALARLPAGTLGRAYLAFVEREKISAEGIRDAANAGMAHVAEMPHPIDWVHARMRDTHDLWHAATGYSGDVLGEISLLAFTFTQTWNPGVALIIAIGLSKTVRFADGAAARRTIFDAFRRGRKSAWLPEQDWEALLELPLDEVRRRLSLEASPVYAEVRSADLKLQAAI
jgi:ubiquinone biosynthesis protein COQ4